ncbi:MAG: protein kinase domain-containing protein [Myxococcota bacterium]
MNGFEVLRKLADGSAAEVFLARDESSQNRVVLEVIRPELCTDMEVYGRFLDEAKERQTLAHPNLLRRQSTGCGKDGRLYAVTEPLDGEHLGSWLVANGPLSPSEMVRLTLPLCDALEYLHRKGLIHGHLRPSNVFLFGTRTHLVPKLHDTGLTLFRSTRSVMSPASIVLVEPEYLSPERIRGQRASALSDIYGMGVLMYEALTGRPPFTSADPAQTRRKHLEEEPSSLPASAERLSSIILRCLAKNPVRRFPSAAALRQALTHHAGDSASPPVPLVRVKSRTATTAIDEPTLAVDVQPPPPPTEALVVGEPVGDIIGNYELLDVLGQGGMGRVFLARHVRLGRKVALKILKPELAGDPTQVARFFQEGQAVGRINHPHIVEFYDFVEEPRSQGGRIYYVMEALVGKTLRDVVRQGPVRLPRAVRIVRQVAQALTAAHQVGVVHRDVKPDNIFLTEREGEDFVKVLDFGVAKLRSSETFSGATQSGMVVGTPSYMAPEQALGEAVDPRADVYSLMSVLYSLLRGKPPFEASSLGALMAKLVTQPALPLPERSAAGDVIPLDLRALVACCLSKKPRQRVQTMAELAQLLAPFEAAPPAPLTREPPRRRRPARRLFWIVWAMALAALAAAWATFQYFAERVRSPPAAESHRVLNVPVEVDGPPVVKDPATQPGKKQRRR